MSTHAPHFTGFRQPPSLPVDGVAGRAASVIEKPKDCTLNDRSFGQITNRKERRAKVAAQELQTFVARFPEFAHHVEKSIALILKDAEKSTRSDRDQVFLAIEQGCTTIAEIMEEPGVTLSKWRIRHALDWLSKVRLIETRPIGPREGSNHNKELHYFTRHTSAFFGK